MFPLFFSDSDKSGDKIYELILVGHSRTRVKGFELFLVKDMQTLCMQNLMQTGPRFCMTLYFASKLRENVQANFRTRFNFNNYPSKFNIHQWITKFNSIGTIQNLNCKTKSPKSGINITARISENIEAVTLWRKVRRISFFLLPFYEDCGLL